MLTSDQSNKNLYQILDVQPSCSHNDIVHAYNRAKQAYSSDSLASYSLMDDDTSKQMLIEVEDAFSVLGNPSKRREYDIAHGFETWAGGSESDKKKKKKKSGSPQWQDPSAHQPETKKSEATIHSSPSPGPSYSSPTPAKQEPAPEVSSSSASTGATIHRLPTEQRAEPKYEPVALEDVPPELDEESSAVVKTKEETKFIANNDFEVTIQNVKEIDGDFLRAVRIYRQMTPDQVGMALKLSSRVIENIENEQIETLNYQPVYIRGHVYMICQVLGLPNPAELAKSYIERMKKLGKMKTPKF